jgi:hypothetical protein
MKKFIKQSYFVMAIMIVFSFASCSDSNVVDFEDPNKEILENAVPLYVNNVVISTYKSLADKTIELYDALVVLKKDKTNDNVKAAVDKWIITRYYWEQSEAFLYGAAADFGIDPHIDTWPVDKAALITLLINNDYINSMDSEDGSVWVGEKLGPGLLGFHGIEYILFEEGKAKDISKISNNELIYAVAVSGDLRNQCIRLEASWAGYNSVTKEKQELIDEFDLGITMRNKSYYGEDMVNAGKAGSTYKSILDANEAIIEGCMDIADEVGTMKIGMPYTGEDVNYIESPYSYNSKVDFIGNIESIRNAYLGGVAGGVRGASVSAYLKQTNPELNTKVINAIDDAVAKIDAIPYPFAKNFTTPQAGKAMEACNELGEILGVVKAELRK